MNLTPIEHLMLPPRAYNALVLGRIDYVEHLLLFEPRDLRSVPGVGVNSYDDIVAALKRAEQEDYYDMRTDFNPFTLKA